MPHHPPQPPTYQAERGKYRVSICVKKPIIEARKEDSPYYVPQKIFIEDVEDLQDLFTVIGSVLDQVNDDR